ncbi:type II CAAX prenyl endopeptidase Rce1 family protein [Herbiconiux sp. P15]|uniref:CPBP family glutamic-type intramembrane protease n=1 Tax=Herbiconiux liukaitaii TaxID=3342799 RepID=UPI0035B91364
MSSTGTNPGADTGIGGDRRVATWALLPAALVCTAAFFIFALLQPIPGYSMLVVGVALAFLLERRGLTSAGLGRDLFLVALAQSIVSTISVKADISWGNMVLMGIVLTIAVAVPYLISRFVFRDYAIRFPWRGGGKWGRFHWGYIALVIGLAWSILPFYFITSGVYLNWPTVAEPSELVRLFVGVNAVGTWDELFFICTIFVLLKRHFTFWVANILQTIVFVSFLWELGYQAWGPLLTIPFALLQGFIFTRTKSLAYVVTVHLLFDAVVFLVIARAHNPGWPQFFLVG